MSIKEINNLEPHEAIEKYLEIGLSIIPVNIDKKPIFKNWTKYRSTVPSGVTLSRWKELIRRNNLNIACVTRYNGILVYDIDHQELFDVFKEAFKEVFGDYPTKLTWVVKTGKGYHVYLKLKDWSDKRSDKIVYRIRKDNAYFEIKRLFNAYAVLPPSIHKTGVKYQWIHEDSVDNILEINEDKLLEFETMLLSKLDASKRNLNTKDSIEERDLTEEEVNKIIELLKSEGYWVEGQRQMVLLAMSYILREFGKIRRESVEKLYEKIRETLGDDPSDYSQRIDAIRLTYEKPRDSIGYKYWLIEAGLSWSIEQVQDFKFKLLKILFKTPNKIFKRGFRWVYSFIDRGLRTRKDPLTGFQVTYHLYEYKILAVKNGRVVDETVQLTEYIDIETKTIIESSKNYETNKKEFLTSKNIEYIKGIITKNGTYVKVAIYEDGKKHIIEGLLSDVLERLYRDFRVITQNGKEKLGQLFSYLAKFEEKTYTYPGIILEGNEFIATVPGSQEFEYLFPETENQAYWIRRVKEAVRMTSEDDFIEYLKALINYKNFLPEEVYYTVLGFSFIAPLLQSLVSITDLKPGLYLIGPKKSGKSTLGKFISVYGYGSKTFARTSLESGFRFDEVFSMATIPVLIDDIERVSPSVVSRLKSMLTGDVEAFRGQGSLKIKSYKLIAVPIITANHDALGLSSDPALLDRLIVLNFDWRLTKDKVNQFRKTIGKLLIGRKTVAPYLLKAIADVSNDLGGLEFYKNKFNEIYEELIDEIDDEGRTIEKATLIILGLIVANEIFKRTIGMSIDLEYAKKIVTNLFNKSLDISEFAPDELINLASFIIEPPEDIEIYTKEINGIKHYAITQELLIKLSQRSRVALPRKLSDLKNMLLSVFNELDPNELYKTIRIGPENKPTKAVLIRENIVYKLLGREEEYKELEEISKKYKFEERIAKGLVYCAICGKRIEEGQKIIVYEGKTYHPKCWRLMIASELTKEETKSNEGEIDNNVQENEILGEPKEANKDEIGF